LVFGELETSLRQMGVSAHHPPRVVRGAVAGPGRSLLFVSAISGPPPEGPIAGELSHPTATYVRHLGTGVIVGGAIAVVCGIVAVAWPHIPLLAAAILIGLTLISLGALSIAQAFQHDLDGGARALIAGLWLFGSGVVEMIRALIYPGHRLLVLLTGAVDVIVAILILSWPKESLGTLTILIGIAFIIRGVLMVYRGVQVRRLA
jgi:uncharacterized membrane protein HdeD (DUF308 family)